MANSDEEISTLETSALALLQQIVEEAHDAPGGDGPIEIGFNYRHANNIAWLAIELLSCIERGHVASPPIIVRAMLESLFNLAASTCINQFPARKIVWELRDYLARAKNLDLENVLGDKRLEILALISRLENQYGLTPNERSWSIARIAREAGTTDFLRKEYFTLSGHTHSSSFALLSRHDGVYGPLIHQTLVSCLVMGAAFAAQLLPIHDPQARLDHAVALGQQQLDLISRGAFG